MHKNVDLAYKLFGKDSVSKALTIKETDISLYDSFSRARNEIVHIFNVNSQHYSYYYDVNIISNGKQVLSFYCECPQFSAVHSCKHVAACLMNYSDLIFNKPTSTLSISNEILSEFCTLKSSGLKKRVGVDIELRFENNKIYFKLKIGLDKKYLVSNESKFDNFMISLLNNEEFSFGAKFTYDPLIHYIDDSDLELLNFLYGYDKNNSYYNRVDPFSLNEREFLSLLNKIKDREFDIYGYGHVYGIKYELPTSFKLNKLDNNYELNVDDFDKYVFLDYDFKYVFYNHILYVISNTYSKFFSMMEYNNLKSLLIDKKNSDNFKNGLLQNIRNDIIISDDIDDIVISTDPSISLYFDFIDNYIECKVKFDYNGNIIDYFDSSSNVIRDISFEDNIINELYSYNFVSDKGLFLYDLDDIGYFLSNGITSLSEKYNVFTSKQIKNTNILKKSNIKSNFSIGTDCIMSYNFDTDNIDTDEIGDILSSLRKKKKFYRLKSGDLIDLENNSELLEFDNLLKDLDINSNNLENGLTIPKYRALYIDSLKKNKYKSITTDNSFDLFIDNFNKYKNIDINFGDDYSVLRDYQRDGVKWLFTLYKCDLGGILADEMGLGKSLQTICFIKQILSEKSDAKFLIVCPTSLVYNWKHEFDKFAPNLKYVTVSENKSLRKKIINKFDDFNIFITSYGLIRNDNDEYENKFFEVCIIDEAQTIKNHQALMTREIKKIKARTKIALTGTPLENSVLELWSIFDFILPGYLNNVHKFQEFYGINDIDKDSLDKLKNLNYQIKPFILRRKKSDVSKDLPDKIENNVYLDLPSKQKALYLSILKESESEFNNILASEGFAKARFKVLQLLTRLRQVCIDPSILFDNYNGESVKMEKLLDIVSDYVVEGHKILIFSSFKTVVERVKKMFDSANISSYIIDGSVKGKDRTLLVDKFNQDSTNCFLITLKAGGTGLNLTSADVVIHLDIWWNPQVENQATDRAHRIGQKKNVSVIKFITRGTIEEKIIELQNKKKILSDNLIEGNDSSEILSNLNENDIKLLLSNSDD